jgi:hypothetical protein
MDALRASEYGRLDAEERTYLDHACAAVYAVSHLNAHELRHHNGRPLVRVYGPRDARNRGATVALNILDPGAAIWDCRRGRAGVVRVSLGIASTFKRRVSVRRVRATTILPVMSSLGSSNGGGR